MEENVSQQNSPNAESFRKIIRSLLMKWVIPYGIFMTVVLIAFIASLLDIDLTGRRTYGALNIGKHIVGLLAIASMNAVGLIAISGVNAVGLIAFGVNSLGLIAFGTNSVGLIAIGCNAMGMIAVGVNAVGFVGIGSWTVGIYVFSSSERSIGRYLFTPKQCDAEAVAFFTRWLPKSSTLGFTSRAYTFPGSAAAGVVVAFCLVSAGMGFVLGYQVTDFILG